MGRKTWLIVAVLLVLGWQWWGRQQAVVATDAGPAASTRSAPAAEPGVRDGLPAEARATLRLIASGGPFPYDRDGAVFGNFEKRLPAQPRGYYHEYTVPTPGAHNRGARRIIAGGQPPDEFWYTDDHYESFRAIGGRP